MRILVGKRLQEERERLELTQADLVSVGGGSKRTVIDWEQGKTAPSAEFLARVAEIGIDVLYVLTGVRTSEASAEISPEEQALLDNYRNADKEGQRAARRILDALAQQKAAGKKRA